MMAAPRNLNSAFRTCNLWTSNIHRKKLLVLPNQNAYVLVLVKENQQVRFNSTQTKFDTTEPFAYYDILGIKRDAKQSEVKQAYFKMVKIYHPDVNQAENARENFDKITEAYTTLIDLTQRYFYDHHGTACEELKKKGSNSTIFDWVPRYSIYEEQTRADGEATEVEDWFKAQGHVGYDKRISLKQRMKNAYVELRYGLSYYNFPWEWNKFFGWLLVNVVFIFVLIEALNYGFRNISYRKPIPIYLKWENTDIYDILWYAGVRKNKSDNTSKSKDGLAFPTNSRRKTPKSEQAIAGMHHMPKREKKASEYSHTIYSNTRSRTKTKNFQRHKARMEENRMIREKSWQEEKDKTKKKKKINDGFSV
eukprot:GFUD01019608.1.p1 GENE.GFUD01019608.1~~GFUD01019608.1.p1  ORF type:complete len:364 (+),score=90.61 GFUD01019608.1:44-1135(+)